jgi:hypothetical protein
MGSVIGFTFVVTAFVFVESVHAFRAYNLFVVVAAL